MRDIEVVCRELCKRGYKKEAWRLGGVQKGMQSKVEARWVTMARDDPREPNKKHLLDTLATKMGVERQCIMHYVLQNPDCLPVSGSRLMSVVSTMRELIDLFKERMMTTLKAVGVRTPYTYQMVQRKGLETRRVFIAFPNAASALHFIEGWMYVQMQECRRMHYDEMTCMQECGSCDETLRKWVMDVDASHADLRTRGFGDDGLHEQVMTMAKNVAHALWEMGFLYRPCHFTVTTRHSAKKMSWHITLNALASHEGWRSAILAMEQKYTAKQLGAMYQFVDESTKKNSKSQYMQIRGSTKVLGGVKGDGNVFREVGLFDGNGVQVEIPAGRHSILFYAASSVVIHDPWSLPFSTVPAMVVAPKKQPAPQVTYHNKRKRDDGVSKKDEDLVIQPITTWDAIPRDETVWIKGLLERKDGETRLISIPSMSVPEYWCSTVVKMVNAGRGQVRLYAKVLNPGPCPKYLKAKKQVHQHGTNHSMVMVVEEARAECKGTSFRMFERCFSEKCRSMQCPHNAGAWVELDKGDYVLFRALQSKCV